MGTQAVKASLWGVKAQDWAHYQESMLKPIFEQVIADLPLSTNTTLLDVGCGAGLFCQLASKTGTGVSGLDATPELLNIAKEKTPNGIFAIGDMETLPYSDNSFDFVTGFNSFQYAASPVTALIETGRVLKPKGKLVIALWGKASDCEAAAYLKALGSLLPPPPPGSPGPFALSDEGAAEALVLQAGFKVIKRENVSCPFIYADFETAAKGLLSTVPAIKAINHSSYQKALQALGDVLIPFKKSDESYRLENIFFYLLCEK